MAAIISLLLPYLLSLTFQTINYLFLVLIVALGLYGICWLTFDVSMALIDLTDVPDPMVDLYILIAPFFLRFDVEVDIEEDDHSTYTPALSLWIVSVLAFVLWALPDWVVTVDPDRFLAQFDMDYFDDLYVLHSRCLFFPLFVQTLFSFLLSLPYLFQSTFPSLLLADQPFLLFPR